LPLDDLYPGLVYGIQVTIWADTAEIIDCHALVFGGEVPLDSLPSAQQVEGTAPLIDTVIIVVTIATISATAIGIITIKKKRK
jgi:hypothetical protein